MLEFFDVSYDELMKGGSDDLYRLRKSTFKDRLNWKVNCINGMEVDEFDNSEARYILGVYNGELVCSMRHIDVKRPNMITHTFQDFFGDAALNNVLHVESSRFFIDKNRAASLSLARYPVSSLLFLAGTLYAHRCGYHGIYTIVSRAMLAIMKRSGLQFEQIKEAYLTENEPIYLLWVSTAEECRRPLIQRIKSKLPCTDAQLSCWPLTTPVT